ncbi:DUF444 family protein [Burkholderia gladioli]
MLHQIIDRRLAGKNKSIANRERFLRRVKNYIRRAVSDAVRDRSIKDIQSTQSITIPRKDIAEPTFRHTSGGRGANTCIRAIPTTSAATRSRARPAVRAVAAARPATRAKGRTISSSS